MLLSAAREYSTDPKGERQFPTKPQLLLGYTLRSAQITISDKAMIKSLLKLVTYFNENTVSGSIHLLDILFVKFLKLGQFWEFLHMRVVER